MMFGLIFYFMKYRTLQKRFINVENCQDGDEMDAFYGGDMQGESPDVIFSDQTRKGRKIYKDSEKVPLEDHDELAMIWRVYQFPLIVNFLFWVFSEKGVKFVVLSTWGPDM